ncbi:MAG: 30S ribosomal protein S17 [Patescibacteria group bacterium]
MPTTATITEKKVNRQTFNGVVISDKMKDTVVVLVSRYVKHPKYHKYMNRKTKIMAENLGNTKKIGDKATVEACRPISKRKAFKVIK